MALTGIQIYKLLPQTNCKDCGFPTCLAFAMKLAAKQVELSACPHVSEASKAQLAESAAPPVRLVSVRANGNEVKAGNEVVLFRHEKTFYHRPGLFIRVGDDLAPEAIQAQVASADAYKVELRRHRPEHRWLCRRVGFQRPVCVCGGGQSCTSRQSAPAHPHRQRREGDGGWSRDSSLRSE